MMLFRSVPGVDGDGAPNLWPSGRMRLLIETTEDSPRSPSKVCDNGIESGDEINNGVWGNLPIG